jgi:ABC-2 type transport system ATP-binding protein
MTMIQASHLYRVFGETAAVRDVHLAVSAGEIYGLVGPDGAGKTTTMRLLCGALRADQPPAGEATSIRIAGFDVLLQVEEARAQIGYLPQRFSLYEDLTVLENIRFFAEARGLPPAEWKPRCMEILEFVGMQEFLDRRAGYLSGGMKQKLGLAAALVHRPRVLLLDEPTTGVDPVTRQDFWQLIIRLVAIQNGSGQATGTAVLVSTPYMDEASRCTRIGFMINGSIIQEGSAEQMRSLLAGRVLELTGEPLPLLRRIVQGDPDVQDVQMFGDRLHARVREGTSEEVIERLKSLIPEAGGQVESFRPIQPQLEDVFMSLVEAV